MECHGHEKDYRVLSTCHCIITEAM